jgi:hypothetical protein
MFAEFKIKVKNLLSCSIKLVQCDGGLEFKPLQSKYLDITFQIFCPHTPEQNGLAERKYRHLMKLNLATMFHASIPLVYWDWVFASVNFVINRLPCTHTSFVLPFEKLFQQKPNYSFLKTIGCACFSLLRPYNNNNFQFHSEQCVFMSYSQLHKDYRCLHIPSQKVYISRNVQFFETHFPFQHISNNPEHQNVPLPSQHLTILPFSTPHHLPTISPQQTPSSSPPHSISSH